MAKPLLQIGGGGGRDSATYPKERDGFLRDLHHFHETRGTPFKRTPIVGGKQVDLYHLYDLVTSQGGWIKVNSKNAWTEILEELDLPKECVNGSVALKQIYLRYLDRWEKVHFLGEEADRGSDDDEESRHKRWSARALHSVPHTYNYSQHIIAEANREYNHLSANLYKSSDYDKLALSLISPLPNEQDFAINVCTLLSNDGKHTLKLDKHPRIIDYLLGHAGVFSHNSLRKLFINCYNNVRNHPIDNFWRDVLESKEYLDLTNENKFLTNNSDIIVNSNNNNNNNNIKKSEIQSDSDSDCELIINNIKLPEEFSKIKLIRDENDDELFCLGRCLGTENYIGQRVLQITIIMRNLSFIDENVPVLLKNKTFLRFLLLCSNSEWNILRNLSMDILGNIASDFLIKDLPNDRLAEVLLKLIMNGVKSEDRAACLSALEIINKLCQNEQNEDTILRYLNNDIYEKVCSFLTIHDVMLLIYTLECLYSLSSLGERSCNVIVNIHGVVDTLVSLVTVEGKSYGPKACIGMKLVETVSGGNINNVQQQSSTSSTVPTTTTTVTTSTPIIKNITTTITTTLPTTPLRTVQIQPQRLLTISPGSTIVTSSPIVSAASTNNNQSMTPQQLIQQQHAHQQAIHENEQFALAWLRATYEPCVNSKIDHQELYKQYLNACSKIGRRGVISPLHFPRCVRSVFGGTVGPNPSKSTTSNETQYYEGIKVRVQPLIINIQSTATTTNNSTIVSNITHIKGTNRRKSTTTTTNSLTVVADLSNNNNNDNPLISPPSSPILKAQLSAPPKQRDTTAPANCKGDMKSQAMAHPHLSQALLGSNNTNTTSTIITTINTPSSSKDMNQSNTSLIKSLLATKVNDCMTTTVSMKTATDCQNVVQVAARQQRLLAQQSGDVKKVETVTKTASRINGARQLFTNQTENDESTMNLIKGKKEPPQPPPPPLAPLSNRIKSTRIDNEDSDSTGNNSLASSSGLGTIGITTEDGENSLTSFEGLLNGIPNIDNPLLNEDSNSKDSLIKTPVTSNSNNNEICKNKPLRLADLLEKKIEKGPLPTLLNGTLNKELRMDLVENHIEKALSRDNDLNKLNDNENKLKRSAIDNIVESEPKKALLTVNGTMDATVKTETESNDDNNATATVSTAAAKLFADMAADILEDEDEEQLMQDTNPVQPVADQQQQQQVLVSTTPRQVIVQQNNTKPAVTQGQTVIVQNNPPQQQQSRVVLQQNTGQQLLLQNIQGQVQLVASTTQPGQYVLQTTSNTQNTTYMVAQSQTAMVHGQPQTVLVAQTPQQQVTGTKTIIILQQQQPNNNTTQQQQQKLMVTPQGQQVVVTQMHRPIIHTSTANLISTSLVKTSTINCSTTTTAATTTTTNGIVEKKIVDDKPKIIRDLTTPFVCEWGDCNIETKFKSANQVYLHVCEAHCPNGSEEIICQWDRCDNMKRKRFSLMTHLHDKHCNTEVMQQSLTRRKQVSQGGKVEPPPPSPATPHPGYAPDAALHAIKRHALEFVNPKELQQKTTPKQGTPSVPTPPPRPGPSPSEQDDNEGPVTKSIRLTASLILRNLVIYSNNCRRYLKHYEPHLANVALSNVESSRTIAQVLYDMNEGTSHR